MDQLVTIDFRKAVIALSDALDLVGVDEVHHGKRVSYIKDYPPHLPGMPFHCFITIPHEKQ